MYSSKMVVLGLKWLYSGKNGYIREKVVVFGQKWLYSGMVVIFGMDGFIRAKVVVSGKVVVFV